MNNEHDKGIDGFLESLARFKNVKLTDTKRDEMFSVIKTRTDGAVPSPVKLHPSWFTALSFKRVLVMRKTIFIYSLAAVVAISAGTGTIFAAESALPGEVLYAIKIDVNERIRDALPMSAATQARWEAKKISRRLEEAEDLAVQYRLTGEAWDSIEIAVGKHDAMLERAIAKLETQEMDFDVFDIRSEVEATLNAHTYLSQKIKEALEGDEREFAGFDVALEKQAKKASETRSAAEIRFLEQPESGDEGGEEETEDIDERFKRMRRNIDSFENDDDEEDLEDVREDIERAQKALTKAREAFDGNKSKEGYMLLLEAERGTHKAGIVQSQNKKLRIDSLKSSKKDDIVDEADDEGGNERNGEQE